jgi:hypothetical protein
MSTRAKFLLTLGLATGVGLYLVMWPWERWPAIVGLPLTPDSLRRSLEQIGEALLTAALLAVMVDKAVKRELLEEFAREVSHHIIGHRLPTQLRDHVLRYLTADVIRTDWDITYTIEPIDTRPDFVRLTTLNKCVLQNTTSREKKYCHSYYVERSWAPEIGESSIKTLALSSVFPGECFELRPGRGLEERIEDNFVVASREITLPPNSSGQYVCFSESVEYFPVSFDAIFVATVPVLRTTVTIYYPRTALNVDLNLTCDGAPRRIELANGTQWLIDMPLIHGHSIVTRWGRATAAAGSGVRLGGDSVVGNLGPQTAPVVP